MACSLQLKQTFEVGKDYQISRVASSHKPVMEFNDGCAAGVKCAESCAPTDSVAA